MPNEHSGLSENKHSLCACLEFQWVTVFILGVAYTQALSLCLFSRVGVRSWGTPVRSPWTWWWLSSFVNDLRKINTGSLTVCKPGPRSCSTPPPYNCRASGKTEMVVCYICKQNGKVEEPRSIVGRKVIELLGGEMTY